MVLLVVTSILAMDWMIQIDHKRLLQSQCKMLLSKPEDFAPHRPTETICNVKCVFIGKPVTIIKNALAVNY